MSVNGDPGEWWPAVEAANVQATSTAIARQVVRARRRRVGLLPVERRDGRALGARFRVAPILRRVAGALTSFLTADVAIIPAIATWTAPDGEGPSQMRTRELAPRLVEVIPPAPQGDGPTRVEPLQALSGALDLLPPSYAHILVDLTGSAPPGFVVGLEAFDAIILVGVTKRTRVGDLLAVDRLIPDDKALGAILVG